MSERVGLYTLVRVAAYGTVYRDEWVNVGVLVGPKDGGSPEDWCGLMASDWGLVADRLRIDYAIRDWVEERLAVRSWEPIRAELESDATAVAMSMIRYREPLGTALDKYPRVTAERLYAKLIAQGPAREVVGASPVEEGAGG